MNKCRIGEVTKVITKGTTPTTVGGAFENSGINFVKSESVGDNKYLDHSYFQFIDERIDQKLKRSRLEKNDLLISIAGAYLGKLSIVREDDLPANTNQAVGIIRLDESLVDVQYLYYYLSQNSVNRYINNLSAQSSQPNLNLRLVGDLTFDKKSLVEQKRISSVLSSLDSKIELNNRINAELEAMAKTVYDYWFVQFDFPISADLAAQMGDSSLEGRPYKTSGGAMVWDERVKREVPEGWEVKPLASYLKVLTGKEDANFATDKGKYPFFTCSRETLRCDEHAFEGKAILLAGNGDFSIKAYQGKFNAYQRTYVLIPEDEGLFGIAFHSISQRIQALTKGSRGSIIKYLTKGDIEDIPVILPKEENLDLSTFNNCLDLIGKNNLQNQELASLRDWLLPMLMNGQVKVGKAKEYVQEKEVGMAAEERSRYEKSEGIK